jgi:hypothetical protein
MTMWATSGVFWVCARYYYLTVYLRKQRNDFRRSVPCLHFVFSSSSSSSYIKDAIYWCSTNPHIITPFISCLLIRFPPPHKHYNGKLSEYLLFQNSDGTSHYVMLSVFIFFVTEQIDNDLDVWWGDWSCCVQVQSRTHTTPYWFFSSWFSSIP